jgi:uncharacterized membrane protein SirB2
MEYYLTLRSIHVTCVMVAAAGFLLRGIWMLDGSPLLDHPLTRTLPHINDSLLLLAAIAMVWIARLNPLDHAWLMAKIGGLVAYVVLGSIALRKGRSYRARALAFAGALLALGYVVEVALTRNPFPLLD